MIPLIADTPDLPDTGADDAPQQPALARSKPDARARAKSETRPRAQSETRLRADAGKDAQDPWHDWKPQWGRAASATPHQLQEQHNPTQSVMLNLSGQETAQCHRRIVDARLWDQMTAAQQRAAIEIARAFESMGRGLGYAASDWTRLPGGRGAAGSDPAFLVRGYVEWTRECHREGISHSMVIDVLCFGFACKMIDRDRRVRGGTTRRNLMEGLSLYCRLRGWPA